jgi:heterodisulfide reductase subunit B
MAREYDRSLRLIAAKVGLELRELPDWTCCGSSGAHSTDELLALALPARNLALAEAAGLPMLAPCALCFNRMKVTQHELRDPARREQVARVLAGGQSSALGTQLQVVSLLQALSGDEMLAAVEAAVTRPLAGLKVVSYYGCLLVRPPEIVQPDSLENPQTMDRLVARLGAQALDWPFKTECCGGGLAMTRTDIVLELGRRLLRMARDVGADAIAVACPVCHSNLDARQGQIKAKFGDDFRMPILYVTELMGLAFGFSPKELMLDKHLTDAMGVGGQG